MDSPDSSESRPRTPPAENAKAPSSCPMPTAAVRATSPSRTPLSTVAVQAAFHKYRTHGEKGSLQARPEKQSMVSPNHAPPTNTPFVTCVPAPLVAALVASPATADAANVDPEDQHQQPIIPSRSLEQEDVEESRDDSNPRSDISTDYMSSSHICHPTEPIFQPTLNRDRDQDTSSQVRGPRGHGMANGMVSRGGAVGLVRQGRTTLGRSVSSGPGESVREPPSTQRSQPALPRQHSTPSGRPDFGNAVDEPVGIHPSDCTLDISLIHRPIVDPLQHSTPYGRIDAANAMGGPAGVKHSQCVLDITPVQRPKTDPLQQSTGGIDAENAVKDSQCDLDITLIQRPKPTTPRQQTTLSGEGNTDSECGGPVGSDLIECLPEVSPTQRPLKHQDNVDSSHGEQVGSTGKCLSDISTQRSQSTASRQQTIVSGSTTDSAGGMPQPPPPPPPSPGNPSYNDPACDPDNPFILQFKDVTSAAFMIRNAITITPCVHSRLSRMSGMDVFLKKDFMQLTGSFKERGARYALLMLTPEQKATGIVAASLGNHALALACHGAQLGIPVTVVMPTRAPLAKVSACRAYGANVIIEGNDMAESRNLALELAHSKGLTYINGYDHPHILAGQGTLGLELLEQVCDVDAIVIPVGGGGLLAGVARAVKTLYPNIKIIAVESENCPSFSAAQAAGRPVLIECQPTIADGLAVPMVGVNAFASAYPLVDRMIVVNEDLIALSILRMVEVEKNVVEGAGAAGVAAMLSGQMDDFKGKRVVILACGGNIDVSMLGRCLERGLVADGRLFSFTVFVDQNPTSLPDLFSLIGRLGASIKDMTHDRKWESEYFFHFPVKIVVETPGASTSRELRTALSQMYKKIIFHHNFEPVTSHQPMYPDFPNLDCGGTERYYERNASSPMGSGLSAHQHQTSLSIIPPSVACIPGNRGPSPGPASPTQN